MPNGTITINAITSPQQGAAFTVTGTFKVTPSLTFKDDSGTAQGITAAPLSETFSFSNPGLSAGAHTITVTDASTGATTSAVVTVQPPAAPIYIHPGSGSFVLGGVTYSIDAAGNYLANGVAMAGGNGTGAGALYNSTVYGQDAASGSWYTWANGTWNGPVTAPPAAGPTPLFTDDFATLDAGQHMDPAHKWSYLSWYGPMWDGDAKGDAWEVNPLNPATPVSGLYTVDGQGNLVLQVARTPSQYVSACGGKAYVSTQMVATSFSRVRGYWEIRCKMDPVQGINFAALWLMSRGTNGHYQEIDILEAVNAGNGMFAAQTVHYDGGAQDQVIQWAPPFDVSQFHTYGVRWDGSHITFYVDRVQKAQYAAPAYYTDPMFPIISAQQGGDWSGPIPAGATLPAKLTIDYVRCYDETVDLSTLP